MTRIQYGAYKIKPLRHVSLTYRAGEKARGIAGRFMKVKKDRLTKIGFYRDSYLVFVTNDLSPGQYVLGKAQVYVVSGSAFPMEPRLKWNGNILSLFPYLYRRIRDRRRTVKAYDEGKVKTKSWKKNKLLEYAPSIIGALEQVLPAQPYESPIEAEA